MPQKAALTDGGVVAGDGRWMFDASWQWPTRFWGEFRGSKRQKPETTNERH